MNRFKYVAVIVVLAFLAVPSSSLADDTNGSGTFAVVDTRQGAVRYNVETGESWLLVTEGAPAWRPIREPASRDRADPDRPNFDDVDWVVVVNSDGTAVGVSARKAPKSGAFSVLEDGDIVTKVNGNAVNSQTAIRMHVSAAIRAKEAVTLTILRDDKEMKVKLKDVGTRLPSKSPRTR